MAILTPTEVRSAYRAYLVEQQARGMIKSAAVLLTESVKSAEYERKGGKTYDIFLSHSSGDAEFVLGLKQILEQRGKSVYIDWIEDPQLDRSKVTPATAAVLRERMGACNSLFFVDTTGSINSQWMPWECGFFDGRKDGKVAILPVREGATENYAGREFLGLYYYLTFENDITGIPQVWVNKSNTNYIIYESWMRGLSPIERK